MFALINFINKKQHIIISDFGGFKIYNFFFFEISERLLTNAWTFRRQ